MHPWTWRFAGLLFGLCSLLPPALAAPPAQKAKAKAATVAGLPPEKALALGERMYREGILPSGEPLVSAVGGTTAVAGTAFSCSSCHLRSGLGSSEGGLVTLPTNGFKLAQPRYWKYPNLLPEERKSLRVEAKPVRPPYTDATLARALRTGVDAGGRALNPAMPRYNFKDADMAILIHYLWSLSDKLSPGADETTLRFATVVTEEVSAQDEEAMLVPLNNYVARHNTHAGGMGNRMYMSIPGKEMAGAYRRMELSVWRLKGPAGTWDRQLREHLARDPVFALLGGLTYGEWQPIHAFCEQHRLPCLFPLTDLPVISEADWYTQYFSKGYHQEGQAAARYLQAQDPVPARVLQIVQAGPEGRALAAGFRETWQEAGPGVVKELQLKPGEVLSADSLQGILAQEQPTVLLLWTGGEAFAALEGLAGLPGRPGQVFLSGRLLGAKVFEQPEKIRAFTWVTWPYRDPKDEPAVSRYANSLMKGLTTHRPERRISTRTYALLQILQLALVDMDRNLYRDNLLDRVGMQRDQVLPDYLQLTFSAGQRYASKGCYVMQLGPGPAPKLIRKSEWVIH